MKLNPILEQVTDRITARSKCSRQTYLDLMTREAENLPSRDQIGCSNLAHVIAAAGIDKDLVRVAAGPNLAIVTAFNDMLSAHQPYGRYPEAIKLYAREVGATAQVAGGVPAMCDGVTQGTAGMELSLFSRDVIALSTAIAMSHAVFDGMALLGVCDKIVPGLLIGALRYGHLPAILIPSGPMPSGIANKEKQKVRQLYAEGKANRSELLDSESNSYHSAGTCTFYGTANSNQVMMEMMGLHLPGAAFIPPETSLRRELTRGAIHRLAAIGRKGSDYRPLGRMLDEKAIVNACVGLLATGGSTNHAIHLPAIARAAGIVLDWSDLDELSSVVPLLSKVYPNGSADVNQFHAAGGVGFIIRELLEAGLVHPDILTVSEHGIAAYCREPIIDGLNLAWRDIPIQSADETILRRSANPFMNDAGMRLVKGNLGRAIFKISTVDPEHWTITAPAKIFSSQEEVLTAFSNNQLNQNLVIVVRFQGPRANGMPELHKLTPPLGVLLDRGFKVALVTDGRMSGASSKVPAAIHLTPEALANSQHQSGPLALLRDGDIIRLCAREGILQTDADLASRTPASRPVGAAGMGRELFSLLRKYADNAEQGGSAMLAESGI